MPQLQHIDSVTNFIKSYLWQKPLKLLVKAWVKSSHRFSGRAQAASIAIKSIAQNHLQFMQYCAYQHGIEVQLHKQYTTYLLSPP